MNANQNVQKVWSEAKASRQAKLIQSARFAMVQAKDSLRSELRVSEVFITNVVLASGAYAGSSHFDACLVALRR